MNTITREEAAALLEAATRGPWRGDRNDGTVKYAILAGEHEAPIVVLSVDHKNGTYGFGCGYGDANETRYADDASADERLCLAAPSLAHTVVDLHDRITELEATLAAERGDPVGALPGWEWRGGGWRRIDDCEVLAVWDRDVGMWIYGRGLRVWGSAPTAREAMRAADAAVTP